MVAPAVDDVPDVVEEGRVFEQLGGGRPQTKPDRGRVEEREREARDLPTVRVRPGEALRKRFDRTTPDVCRAARWFGVWPCQVEEEPLAQRPGTGGELRRSPAAVGRS